MVTHPSDSAAAAALCRAADGDAPDRWPLPAAGTDAQRWLRAVAAGGLGHYAVADTELSTMLRRARSDPMRSLAMSARGSFARQLGGHRIARGFDGAALALAGEDAVARADALTGLAADALGLGRFAASATLLDRLRDGLATPEGRAATAEHPRLRLRMMWVSAELAMVTGDGAAAVDHAARAAAHAAATPVGERRRIKTALIAAAAACSASRIDDARERAERALGDARRFTLLPLVWASASLLAGIGSGAGSREELIALREVCAAEITRRGGAWR